MSRVCFQQSSRAAASDAKTGQVLVFVSLPLKKKNYLREPYIGIFLWKWNTRRPYFNIICSLISLNFVSLTSFSPRRDKSYSSFITQMCSSVPCFLQACARFLCGWVVESSCLHPPLETQMLQFCPSLYLTSRVPSEPNAEHSSAPVIRHCQHSKEMFYT